MTISATYIVVPVCSKTPLLYLLIQKVAQKFGYVLGIGESRIVRLNKVSYLCIVNLNILIIVQGKKQLSSKPKFAEVVI